MKTNLLLKLLLATGLTALLAAGCGQRTPTPTLKDKAIVTLDKIKSEKQLGLVEYEVRKIVKGKDKSWYPFSGKSLLCSCKAYLKAGIDLENFNPMTDVTVDEEASMITIVLPSPTLLSLNMPVDSIDVQFERKEVLTKAFKLAQINDMLRQGETQIHESVPELGILDDARRNARQFFEPLFRHLGFTSVQIDFKDEKTK